MLPPLTTLLRIRAPLSSRPFSSTVARKMKVVPVPCRSDNYMYLLIDSKTKKAAAVDPYDVGRRFILFREKLCPNNDVVLANQVPKLQAAADKEGVELVAVLTTHHHHDHADGNPDFAAKYPDTPIYGGSKQVKAVTHIVKDSETLSIGEGIHVKCLATPCHTQDSICYHVTSPSSSHPGGVFTGDTLFAGGCGRFFEGTGAEMHKSLSYLGTLPDQTVVYHGHEYTKSNAAFGRAVDPENAALKKLEKLASDNAVTTGLSTIGDEKEWNVFMRLSSDSVLHHTGFKSGSDEGSIMDKLREHKNNFRG